MDLCQKDLCRFFVGAWFVWFQRNRLVKEGSKLQIEEIPRLTENYLKDIDLAVQGEPDRPQCTQPSPEKWKPPICGTVKMNTDVAIDPRRKIAWAGCVVRDHRGEFVAAMVGQTQFCVSSLENEAKAMLLGVEWFHSISTDAFVIETDSSQLHSGIRSESSSNNEQTWLVDEVRRALSASCCVGVQKVKRSANNVAHQLARFGLRLGLDQDYRDLPPDVIRTELQLEKLGLAHS